MPEKVRLQFYTIEKCGYYNDESHRFCSFAEMISQIDGWAKRPGQRLRQLKTFQCASEADPPTVYLLGLCRDPGTGDYLLATWNETPNVAGASSSLRADNQFGQAVVDATAPPVGNIIGYATYFWLLPTYGIFATVKTESETALHNGHRGLCRFFAGFLARFSSHVVASIPAENSTSASVAVSGYRQDASAPVQALDPCFESHPARRAGPLNEIRRQRASITKIIYRHKLRTSEHQSRRIFQKFLIWITGEKPPAFEHATNFKAEMLFKPTSEELEKAISRWQQTPADNWNNVGFKVKGRSGILWLKGLFVKASSQLEVERSQGVIDAPRLLAQLVANREQFIALLNES